MMARRLFAADPGDRGEEPPRGAPLGGTRSEALQRLQIGVFGICAMVLLVGLASIIGSQADRVEETAAPDAAPTTEPTAPSAQRDPLADAGVVPPTETKPKPEPEPSPGPQSRSERPSRSATPPVGEGRAAPDRPRRDEGE